MLIKNIQNISTCFIEALQKIPRVVSTIALLACGIISEIGARFYSGRHESNVSSDISPKLSENKESVKVDDNKFDPNGSIIAEKMEEYEIASFLDLK